MRIRKEYTTLGVLLALNGVGWASRLPTFQQPETHRSPDGAFELHLDPSDQYGTGPATYTMRGSGEVLWKRELPFTLSDAIITVEGNTIGYALSNMEDSDTTQSGNLILSYLSLNGDIIRTKRFPTAINNYKFSPFQPTVSRMFYTPEKKLGWFYLTNNQDYEENGVLITFDESQEKFNVPVPLTEYLYGKSGKLLDLVVIEGVPLLAIAWQEEPFIFDETHQWISILDSHGKELWRHPRTICDESQSRIYSRGPKLLTFIDKSLDTTFQLQESNNSWEVLKLSDVPAFEDIESENYFTYNSPEDASTKASLSASKPYRKFSLEIPNSPADAAFVNYNSTFDDQGNIYFISSPITNSITKDKSHTLIVNNKIEDIRKIPLNIPYYDNLFIVGWLDDDSLLLSAHKSNNGEMSEYPLSTQTTNLFQVNVITEKIIRLNDFLTDDAHVHSGLRTSKNGTILVRHTKIICPTACNSISLYNLKEECLWSMMEHEFSGTNKDYFHHITDACLLTDGTIAVLDDSPARVELISSDGTRKGAINLEESWGYKPNYLSNIHPGPDGTIVVTDYNGRYPTVHMDATGKVLHKYRKQGTLDPFGAFWVSDGFTLKQENEEGEVIHTIGYEPLDPLCGPISYVNIDQQGRIYLLPTRSGVPFVFDGSGKVLYRADISHDKFPISNPEPYHYKILIPGDGSLYYTLTEYVESSELPETTWTFLFDKSGERVSEQKRISGTSELDLIYRRPNFFNSNSPFLNNDRFWLQNQSGIILRDLNGQDLLKIYNTIDEKQVILLQSPIGHILVQNNSFTPYCTNINFSVYDSTGSLVSTLNPQTHLNWYLHQSAWDGQYFYVPLKDKIVVFNSQGEALTSVPVPSTEKTWKPFVTKTGSELWLFDGEREVVCYKIAELISPTITASE
ncbi:MAG: hypothetical protein SFY68_11105 [Candidatus Sumerlaeia bacterium]|nr:hypothetical protein [Candidatus Sumerlaeia bacterium]